MRTYNIQLNETEIAVVERALTAYEGEPHMSEMLASTFKLMLMPKPSKEEETARMDEDINRATNRAEQRKRETAGIRHRLSEVQSRRDEFSTLRD